MPIQKEIIYQLCGHCGGDRVITTTSPIPPYELINIPCHQCQGTGGHVWGWSEKELP